MDTPPYGLGDPVWPEARPGAGSSGAGVGTGKPGSGWNRPRYQGPSGQGQRGTQQGFGRGSDAGRGKGPSATGVNPRQGGFRD